MQNQHSTVTGNSGLRKILKPYTKSEMTAATVVTPAAMAGRDDVGEAVILGVALNVG